MMDSEETINPRAQHWPSGFIPEWLGPRTEISPGAKNCYGVLCRHYNPKTGQCNPRHKVLAKELGIGARMAQAYIKELLVHNLIVSKARGYKGSVSNNYSFTRHKWSDGFPERKKRTLKPSPHKNVFTDADRIVVDDPTKSTQKKIAYLRSLPYREYLKTEHWQSVRLSALQAAEFRCMLCYGDDSLDVHHRTYKRRGCERKSDVIALCRRCHTDFHKEPTE